MWHREDSALLASTNSASSFRSRRGTDLSIAAQPVEPGHSQPELPYRWAGGSYATDSRASPGPYSPLSTKGLSNPALGEIRSRRSVRRGGGPKPRERAGEESMRAGESRDRAAAATAGSRCSFPSHLQSSLPQPSSSSSSTTTTTTTTLDSRAHVPLRKRALTSHLPQTIETPSVPDPPSSHSYAPLYDRPRRSNPNLSLNLSSIPTRSSASPLSPISPAKKKSRDSTVPDSPSSPSSPNAPRRTRSSHIAQQARSDVKSAMPSTTTYVQSSPLASQGNHATNGLEKGQEDGYTTPNTTDAKSGNEDIFLNIARTDSGRRGSVGRPELQRVSNLTMGRPR